MAKWNAFVLFAILLEIPERWWKWVEYFKFSLPKSALREILLVVLTKRSQLYIFSKQYQKFCKTYQCSKFHGTKYATNFFCKIDQIHLV